MSVPSTRRAIVLLAAGALVLGVLSLAPPSGGSAPLTRVSAVGDEVTAVTRAGRRTIGSPEGARVYRLATLHGNDYFRIESRRDGTCFGTGRAVAPGAAQPTYVYCKAGGPKGFPSPAAPVLASPAIDVAGPPGSGREGAELLAFDGFAADGVESVELVQDGRVVASARVTNNVYALEVGGLGLAGSTFVARGGDGNAVYRRSY